MDRDLFERLLESVRWMELERLNREKAVSENIAAINEEGRPQNQAILIAMQNARQTRKDKGKQARKQRGKSYRS